MSTAWKLAPLAVLAGLLGCRSKAPLVTGLYVTVRFDGITVDQVQLTVTGPTPDVVLVSPTMRPAQRGGPLTSPQTLSIYLADSLAGTAVTCAAVGFLGGSLLDLEATATAVLRQGVLMSMELTLAGPTGKANGQSCGVAGECASALCVDGVCCASSCGDICQACNLPGKEGTCSSVPTGTPNSRCAAQPVAGCGFDGTCDGSGGCRRYPQGVACRAAACQAGKLIPPAACDGQGTCVAAAMVDCAPFACDATAGAPRCRSDCVTGADCVLASACVNGSCGPKPKQANGAGCLTGGDCLSTFCVGGVCCDGACDGRCMACNQAGSSGACGPVASGKIDPSGLCPDQGVATCGSNGQCDGAGGCLRYPLDATCDVGACNGRSIRNPRRCDGQGMCLAAPNIDCAPYRCDPATTACYGSCTANPQCAAGSSCDVDGGVCR